MRVLQITAFSGWGCTGRIAVGINDTLVAQGEESVIAWGRVNTAPATVRTIRIGNKIDQQIHGLYTRLTDRCGFGSKKATKAFLKRIDRYKPDLIQIHILHGYYINLEILFNYIKKHNIPVVWTFHDCWAFTGHCPYFDLVHCEKWKTECHNCQQKARHPTSWVLDNSKLNWNKKKEIFSELDSMTVVTPSHWLAELVSESFFKKYVVKKISNGINLNTFKPSRGEFLKKFNLDNKIIILGVSSTWATSKGLQDFCLLSKILPDKYQIVLVGLNEEQLKVLPKEVIGIARTDSVEELAELYTAASIFVNPTYEDNFPTTNIEALACGTPVITYNTGGSIEAAGNTYGKVIEQGDIESLKEYILSEQWKDISSQSCIVRAREFDERKRFVEYIDLYRKILQEKC